LLLTMLLGATFLGVKAYEYHHKWEERLVPGRYFNYGVFAESHNVSTAPPANEASPANPPAKEEVLQINPRNVELFFSFYFAMTGLHALHMVIGIAILAILAVAAMRRAFDGGRFTHIEMTGLYWHFVDIVWVFLFPLLYLIR
jgi:cytochrome c oxidase subunit 3